MMLLCCKYTKSLLHFQTKAEKTIVVYPINVNSSILKNLRYRCRASSFTSPKYIIAFSVFYNFVTELANRFSSSISVV